MPYSTTLSIKKDIPKKPKAVKDREGGSRVGISVVEDSMGFFKTSLSL